MLILQNPPENLPIDAAVARVRPPAKTKKVFCPAKSVSPPEESRKPSPSPKGKSSQSPKRKSSPSPTTHAPEPDTGAYTYGWPDHVSPTNTFDLPTGETLVVDRWKFKKTSNGRWNHYVGPFHGKYHSPEYPQGMQSGMSVADIVAAIICHAKASDRHNPLTLAKVSNALHWDFKVDKNNAARQVVNFWSGQIAAKLRALDPAWKATGLYKELIQAKFDVKDLPPIEKANAEAFTVKGQIPTHRASKTSRKVPVRPKRSRSTSLAGAGPSKRSADSPPAGVSGTTSTSLNTQPSAAFKKAKKATASDVVSHGSGPQKQLSSYPDPAPETADMNGKQIPKQITRALNSMRFD